MRVTALRIVAGLSAVVAAGVVLQVYLIASYFFGAEDALDAHKNVGGVVRIIEVVVFLVAIAAWWRRWDRVGLAFALPLVGTIQLALSGSEDWVGGLHGLLALAVMGLAASVGRRAITDARDPATTTTASDDARLRA